MKPALVSFSLFAWSSLLAAQVPSRDVPGPSLAIDIGAERVGFAVSGPKGVYLGAVVLSLRSDLANYLQGLPPLLADFVVLGVGAAYGDYHIDMPLAAIPPGITIYAQGIVSDVFVEATAVESLLLVAAR